jgi:hypothetical protein
LHNLIGSNLDNTEKAADTDNALLAEFDLGNISDDMGSDFELSDTE